MTLEELQAGLAKQGSSVTHNEVAELIASLDLDANGSIDYDEFLAATVQMSQLQVWKGRGWLPFICCMRRWPRCLAGPRWADVGSDRPAVLLGPGVQAALLRVDR